jgi:DNA-binding transcriptional MerR regulator
MNHLDHINVKISTKTIQQVSEQLNLPKSTIRFWEKEFEGYIRPKRSQGGQRRYSEDDMAALASIHAWREQGLSLAQIKEQLMRGDGDKTALDMHAVEQLTERITKYVRREIYNFLKPAS